MRPQYADKYFSESFVIRAHTHEELSLAEEEKVYNLYTLFGARHTVGLPLHSQVGSGAADTILLTLL